MTTDPKPLRLLVLKISLVDVWGDIFSEQMYVSIEKLLKSAVSC